ncbi:MAG: dockerin type I repeat-containing protein, partial [Phycisphaerae bacterium]|nr:dockerin type I repeat-containing protein [Phycisphaerae bacterium]
HVIRMYLSSTSWTQAFKDSLAARNLGGNDGLLICTDGLTPNRGYLPWVNLNQIIVQFNQAVDVPENSVTLSDPAGVPISLENDLSNARLIITVDNFQISGNPVPYLLTLAQSITSVFDELPLDGNNDRIPGDAALRSYRVFPGDIDASGVVDTTDFATLNAAFFTRPTNFSPQYNPLADLDGNAAVNIVDFAYLARNFNRTFPLSEGSSARPAHGAARSDIASLRHRFSQQAVATAEISEPEWDPESGWMSIERRFA